MNKETENLAIFRLKMQKAMLLQLLKSCSSNKEKSLPLNHPISKPRLQIRRVVCISISYILPIIMAIQNTTLSAMYTINIIRHTKVYLFHILFS